MLTPRIKRLYILTTRLGRRLGIFPYVWDDSAGRLNRVVPVPRWGLVPQLTLLIHTVLCPLKVVMERGVGYTNFELSYLTALTFCRIAVLVQSYFLQRNCPNNSNLLNSVVSFDRRMKYWRIMEDRAQFRFCENFMSGWMVISAVICAISANHYFGQPSHPIYMYNLFEGRKGGMINWGVFIACGIEGLYFVLTALTVVALQVYTATIVVCFLFAVMKQLRTKKGAKYWTSRALRAPELIIPYYRTCQMISILSNDSLRPMMYLTSQTISYASICCIFILIKYHGTLSHKEITIFLGYAMLNTVGWVGILLLFGAVSKKSSGMIASWKHTDWGSQRGRMKRFLRSCRPLQLQCGHFHSITYKKAAAFLSFVFWGVTKANIIFGKGFGGA